ncbi:MAG: TetR family transcriptional regulator [Nocardioidaceae bacterium]
MTETVESTSPGLRERKKQATRRAIRRAAVALALEHGTERLTVEAISEAADVSPRTFFNYFSCKEDALVGDSAEGQEDLRQLIMSRPSDEPPMQTVRAVLVESSLLGNAHTQREEVLARQRLVRENPSLLPRQLSKYAAIERTLAEAMAERLDTDPAQDLRPAMLAALGVTVVRVAVQSWTTDGTRPLTTLIDDAFHLLERGI